MNSQGRAAVHAENEAMQTISRGYLKFMTILGQPFGVVMMAFIGALVGSIVGANEGVHGSAVGVIFGSMIGVLLAILYQIYQLCVRHSNQSNPKIKKK